MSDVTLTRLADEDLEELRAWHGDGELSRRYGGHDWPAKLLDITKNDPGRTCFVAWNDGRRVGYVDFEVGSDSVAWIGLAVAPSLRGEGWGKAILRCFLESPESKNATDIRAGIEPDNVASVRCFEGAGFAPMRGKSDEEGIVTYAFVRR